MLDVYSVGFHKEMGTYVFCYGITIQTYQISISNSHPVLLVSRLPYGVRCWCTKLEIGLKGFKKLPEISGSDRDANEGPRAQ